MDKTISKIDEWTEKLAKEEKSEELSKVITEMYKHFGDLGYEMNRMKMKLLTYEGYLEGLGRGDLIMDEFYYEEEH